MNYWLMKSEPDVFGIDDLKRVKVEPWDGIRNYQARNFMRDTMKRGDKAFFYHSNTDVPGIVGTMTVHREAYPDHTALDPDSKYFDPKSTADAPRWMMVDVKFSRKFKRTVSLAEMREDPALDGFRLLQRGQRLSILPVEPAHWDHILTLV
ncbi:MAG: EVE domain-containing protein [Pseudomonadota bacterium]